MDLVSYGLGVGVSASIIMVVCMILTLWVVKWKGTVWYVLNTTVYVMYATSLAGFLLTIGALLWVD